MPKLHQIIGWKHRRARRVPTRLQYQTTECGVAALAMILAYHRRYVPMEDIRVATGVSRDCLNAADMVRAGRFFGLESVAYTRDLSALPAMTFPFVAHLRFIHFVVVEGMTPDRVLVNDPACGRHEIPIEEFDEIFTGIVITFLPGPAFAPGGQPDSLLLDLWRRIDRRTKADLLVAFAATCLTGLPLLALAAASSALVETGGAHFGDFLAAIALALATRAALLHVQARALRRAQCQMSAELAGEFLATLLHRPFAYLGYRLPSEQVKSVADHDAIARLVCRDLLPVVFTLPSVGILLAAMIWLHPVAGMVSAASTIVYASILAAAALWRSGAARRQARQADENLQSLSATIGRLDEERFAGMDHDFVAGGMGAHARRMVPYLEDAIARIAGNAVARVMEYTLPAGAMVTAGLAYRAGDLALADLIALLILSCALAWTLRDWPLLRTKLSSLHHALLRQDDLDGISETAAAHAPTPVRASPGASPLRLRSVVFGHSPTRAPLLRGIDFAFQDVSEQVGLTGPSGGGKSTFGALAAGLHQPWSGSIDAGPRVLWVDKNTFLFEGTIRENLALWREDIGDADLWAALRDARVDDVIAARAEGLDARVSARGRNFSGGQRQRLEIARALTWHPKVLILDEALDALDPALEVRLRAALRARDCAAVIISHRASTLAACDRILHCFDGVLHEHPPGRATQTAEGRARNESTFPNSGRADRTGDDSATSREGLDRAFRQLCAANFCQKPAEADGAVHGIVGRAKAAGLYAREVRFVQAAWWRRAHLPLIGFDKTRGAPTLLTPSAQGYRATEIPGPISSATMTKNAYCLYPPGDLQGRGLNTLFRKGLIAARADIVRAAWLAVALAMATPALAAGIASLLSETGADTPMRLIISILGGLAIVGLLEVARLMALLRLEARVETSVMAELYQRLIRLRPAFLRKVAPEDLARSFAAISRIFETVRDGALLRVSDIARVFAGLGALAWFDTRLALIATGLLLPAIVAPSAIAAAALPHHRAFHRDRTIARRFLSDVMHGVARLRTFGVEANAARIWREMHDRQLRHESRMQAIVSTERHCAEHYLWAALSVLIATASGSGEMVALALICFWPTAIAALNLGTSGADAVRALDLRSDLDLLLQAPLESKGMAPERSAIIDVDKISFRYGASPDWTLREISLRVAPDEMIAVVGPSGCGKSTLLRLLLGLEDPQQGAIYVDGVAHERLDLQTWRRKIGLVQQDDRVESASTLRSIVSGLAPVDLDEVWRAVKLVELGDEIRAMPMGMQTIVEQGKISTGQEQRLLIARQLIRRPALLILDEATNAVPEEMQARLFRNIRAQGIACVLVTHRESAITAVDRVYMLEAGRNAWTGSPSDFLTRDRLLEIIRKERLMEEVVK